MSIQETAAKYGDYLIQMRRYFHTNPEVSGKEYNTSERVKKELDGIGVPWRKCGLETGVLATIQGARPGRTILIRGDMDALTVKEETGLPYASVNEGVMHACGHDCHTSMLLTAAHVLNDLKSELCGTVRLAFQPAEEAAIGAKAMIAEGAMDGVDACFGIHVWSDVASGKVSVEGGPRMASADQFKIDIIGKGGHGATPHHCIDAAVAASAVVGNLQTIVSREINPVDPAVITVGVMQVGTRWNVVPEYAHLEGTTRCFSGDVWKRFPEMMDRIVTETGKTFRTDARLDYIRLVPPTINDEKISAIAQNAVRKVVAEDANVLSDKTTGGEDFAYFMEKAPGAIALLGVRNEACDAVYAQHSGKYRVDENALIHGAMLYAQVAMDFNAQ